MKCSEIVNILEQSFPLKYAEDWDNVGLIIGEKDKEVSRILIALDATEAVIEKAVSFKADMLITHHPLIFKGVKKITYDDFLGKRIIKLIQNNISYYAMHTNFDVCKMADLVADKLELVDTEPLEKLDDNDFQKGIGKIGTLKAKQTAGQCIDLLKIRLQLGLVTVYGNTNKEVSRIAILPGSGSKWIKYAIKKQANLLITGDIDYHSGVDAVAQGLIVADAGHYATEKIMIDYTKKFLLEKVSKNISIECIIEDVLTVIL